MSIHSHSDHAYTHPDYDLESYEKTTELLVELAQSVDDNSGAAGTRKQVDPIKQLLVTAYGFGTLPHDESLLINVQPDLPSDGAYTLTVRDVPVDGFWSLAVYNKEGYFAANPQSVYGYSDRTATRNADGSITLHFGGDPASLYYTPLPAGWNYVIRLYRPRQELLDGRWVFPGVRPIE